MPRQNDTAVAYAAFQQFKGQVWTLKRPSSTRTKTNQHVQEGEERILKRALKAYHAPWETTPAHCLDLDPDRSAVDEMDLARCWAYLAKP